MGGAHGEPPSAKEIPSPGFTQRPGGSADAGGARWEVRPKGVDARDNTTESPKRTGTSWRSPESWSSSECGPALLSLGQESREEFRPKSKEETLPGLFYEVVITLNNKPVKNSAYSKIQSTKIPK